MSYTAPSKIIESTSLGGLISPRTRTAIVIAKAKAMRGDLPQALESLARAADNSPVDWIANEVTKAELLYLDNRADESVTAFRSIEAQAIGTLPQEICAVLEQDKVMAIWGKGFPSAEEVDDNLGRIDRRRLLRIQTRNADALLDAREASEDGKNYKSYPVYYSALVDAYRRFDWSAMRVASGYLSRELLRLNQPTEAAFHAVISEQEHTVKALAEYLNAVPTGDAVDKVVRKILEVCHLKRHLEITAKLVAQLGDAIPDGRVGELLDTFRPHRVRAPVTLPERWLQDACWEATTAILQGANEGQADRVIDEILGHEQWGTNEFLRHTFCERLQAAIEVGSEAGCQRVIEGISPNITTSQPGVDFERSLHILLTCADRYPTCKSLVRDRIYVNDRQPCRLVQVAPFFEVELKNFDAAEQVSGAIERLRLQVERLKGREQPKARFGEPMIETKVTEKGAFAVRIGGSLQELWMLASHRKSIPTPKLDALVRVILETIQIPENANENRVSLFGLLPTFCDVATMDTATEAARVAAVYAADHRVPGHPLNGQPEDHNVLSSTRLGMGWPQEVRGSALIALAELSKSYIDFVRPLLIPLLLQGITDRNPDIRRDAYHAVYLAGAIAVDCLPNVIAGARDDDPRAADIALQVCRGRTKDINSMGLVPQLIGILEIQYRHSDSKVRRAAAGVVYGLFNDSGPLDEAARLRLTTLLDRLKSDASRQVRRNVTSGR